MLTVLTTLPVRSASQGESFAIMNISIAMSIKYYSCILKQTSRLATKSRTPVIILQYRSSSHDSTLTELLRLKSALSVKEAEDNVPIQPGAVYLAPGDYHLLIETNNTFSLDQSEKVMFSRPNKDVTLQTAADAIKVDATN